MTPFLFVGGKGGVGKTTCAAALALAAARHRRTLLITTDPASSLGDVLDVGVTAAPRRIPRVPNLDAVNVDAAQAFERWLAPRRSLLATIALRGTYLDEEDVGRLLNLSLPGIDEVMGLLEISRLAARGYDHVVVDTAPTGHTRRLLSSPALLARVAEVLETAHAHHRVMVDALRGRYTPDEADILIEDIELEARSLADRLRDPAAATFAWVTLPEPMALEETADAMRALEDEGIQVPTLMVNRVTPPPLDRCAWCSSRRRFEARALAPLARRFPDVEFRAVPQLDAEPRGLAALRRVAASMRPLAPGATPPAIAYRVRAVTVTLPAEAGSHGAGPSSSGASALRRKDTPRGELAPPSFVPSAVAEPSSVASAVAQPSSVASAVRRKHAPRWILFGGKGGVGKSTCAAAFALHLASTYPRRDVLLVSSDPAHSLGDVLGVRLGNRAVTLAGAPPNLRVREIDAAANLADFRARYLASVDEAFGRITRSVDVATDRAAFRHLIDLAPPGVDEVIAIAEVAESLAAPSSDPAPTIVSDTAPTGHALRLLQTPAVMRGWTQALMAILLKYRAVIGGASLGGLLVQFSKRLRHLEAVLRDPAQARFIIVTRPFAVPRAETVRLRGTLEEMGIPVGGVIVNAMGAGTCRRCRAIERAHAREIGALRVALDGGVRRRGEGATRRRPGTRRAPPGPRGSCAIIGAPAEVPPPHGVMALAAWTSSWRHIT